MPPLLLSPDGLSGLLYFFYDGIHIVDWKESCWIINTRQMYCLASSPLFCINNWSKELVYNSKDLHCLSLVLELGLSYFVFIYPETFLLTIFYCIFLTVILAFLLVVALKIHNGPHPVLH